MAKNNFSILASSTSRPVCSILCLPKLNTCQRIALNVLETLSTSTDAETICVTFRGISDGNSTEQQRFSTNSNVRKCRQILFQRRQTEVQRATTVVQFYGVTVYTE